MLFAEITNPAAWSNEVWLAFFAFLTLVAGHIFQIVQNWQLKNKGNVIEKQNVSLEQKLDVHDQGAIQRDKDIKAIKRDVQECKDEVCKVNLSKHD